MKKVQKTDNNPVFTKKQILSFETFARRKDLLSVLLDDDEEYTMDQVQGLIDNFMKG